MTRIVLALCVLGGYVAAIELQVFFSTKFSDNLVTANNTAAKEALQAG
jgi:hypothetical protein